MQRLNLPITGFGCIEDGAGKVLFSEDLYFNTNSPFLVWRDDAGAPESVENLPLGECELFNNLVLHRMSFKPSGPKEIKHYRVKVCLLRNKLGDFGDLIKAELDVGHSLNLDALNTEAPTHEIQNTVPVDSLIVE